MLPRKCRGAGATRLIVGLGNPSPAYEGTRHNVGFRVAGELGKRWDIRLGRKGCSALFGEGFFSGQEVRLALPQTFMNASGESVACLLKRWRLKPSETLVVCDDVSLPVGAVRLRVQGSAGGHLGLASVLEELGTEQVARLRVGVGPKERPGKDLAPFVLGKFSASEKEPLKRALELAVEACEMWVSRGPVAAMNRFNQKITERSS